jgi:hypothetical protein
MVAMFLLIRCINRKTVSDRIRRDLCVLKLLRHVPKIADENGGASAGIKGQPRKEWLPMEYSGRTYEMPASRGVRPNLTSACSKTTPPPGLISGCSSPNTTPHL